MYALKTMLGVFTLLITLNGCAQKEAVPAAASLAREVVYAGALYSADSDAELSDAMQFLQKERNGKLITTADVQIRIGNLDNGAAKINELIEKYNAYAASTWIYENSRSYTLKIPEVHYKLFVEALMDIGKVIHYSEKIEDVTTKYYDLESHLTTKKALLKTYQSYLEKAKSIDELLSVEARIAELQEDIDAVGKDFQVLSNLIEYATVELEVLGPVMDNKESIGNRIRGLFTGLGTYAATILIILLAIVVYGIPAILILIVLYWILLGKIGLLKKVWRFVSGKI
ncbi:MAG: DUF4349 domain-containing protein [Treponema sp.]|jgi:hypothetical protein|nr:DUF4349 domain-containing protein [Treponema sp.]